MDGTRERRVVQRARRLLFDPEHAFRDRGAAFARPESRKIRDEPISEIVPGELLNTRDDGAVFILFFATHAFWVPLAADDPQQLVAALVVR